MSSISTILDYLKTAAVFALVIPLLVAVHELGHYLAAKMFGMKVEAFAVMVGGIRKTNLHEGLPKKMVSPWVVFSIYLATAAITVVAAVEGWTTLLHVGLFSLAIVLPSWIALRIGALYRFEPARALKYVVYAQLAGAAILMMGAGGKQVQITPLLTVMFYMSLVGLLVLYYHPVLNKDEDSPMGHGAIEVDGEKKEVMFRPVVSRTNKDGTEFSLLALPLGGFVRIKGIHPKPDGSETQIEGGFYSKSPFARFITLAAGPFFSLLLGSVLLFTALAIYGERVPSTAPVLGVVDPTGPGFKGGLREGDRIVSIDQRSVDTFFDLVAAVRDADRELAIEFVRDGTKGVAVVRPVLSANPTPVMKPDMEFSDEMKRQYQLRIGPSAEMRRMPVDRAALLAIQAPVRAFDFFGRMFSDLRKAGQNVSGPGGIAQATHSATQDGVYAVLMLAAELTISLGIFNLLPIPPLDGGQMLVALTEMLRGGKRLSIKTQSAISTAGVVMLIFLVLAVQVMDAGRLVGR